MARVTKHCYKCGEHKPREEFNKDRSKPDGLQARCKPCNRENNRRWRKANPERNRAINRKANRKRYRKLRRERPYVYRAQEALHRARKHGVTVAVDELEEIQRLYKLRPHLSALLDCELDVAHIVPLERGGPHALDNLTFLPRAVNISQGKKLVSECKPGTIAGAFFAAPPSY